jgi:hypothetical protein
LSGESGPRAEFIIPGGVGSSLGGDVDGATGAQPTAIKVRTNSRERIMVRKTLEKPHITTSSN